ncbi:hypothetical protein UFOVP223_43 [uncultured Caudovirales phage]|uniref:Uncharacterized protein n=1 Tax=uncultured Caudovirales phage TaxID=2100421 RepID=A0A6J5L2J9_9CAUD|nr:hypothetical protein UFOVP110_121 [uncultured Caudovirales phage]CAB5219228.1 hypothetical protein UFOVP223_43 [uncultured Caudovirales phage]
MSQYDYYLTGGIASLCVAVAIVSWRLNVVNKNLHYMRQMVELFAKATIHHFEEVNGRVDALSNKKKSKQDA